MLKSYKFRLPGTDNYTVVASRIEFDARRKALSRFRDHGHKGLVPDSLELEGLAIPIVTGSVTFERIEKIETIESSEHPGMALPESSGLPGGVGDGVPPSVLYEVSLDEIPAAGEFSGPGVLGVPDGVSEAPGLDPGTD